MRIELTKVKRAPSATYKPHTASVQMRSSASYSKCANISKLIVNPMGHHDEPRDNEPN